MPIPDFTPGGLLPPGIYAATLQEVRARYEQGSDARQQRSCLLQRVVETAIVYSTIKRVLIWGSYVTTEPEPNDLDYSLIVSVEHDQTQVTTAHRRFVVPFAARRSYGVDAGYLVIRDYPLEAYVERLDFICQRSRVPCGIIESNLRGEIAGERP
jgi:hypothetical protein